MGTRLGVVLDLAPEKFGRNTKDGVLLARLLYGYGVIPVHVLQKVKETKNYYCCYENLKVLRPWLEHIGVSQDDAALKNMAMGEGSSAISIFYSVYLNLETKDRLYYISAQKERKFSESSCKRDFKVEWVPEFSLRNDSGDGPSQTHSPFIEKQDMIQWHRKKCKDVVDKIKKVKLKFSKRTNRKESKLGPVISRHSSFQPLDKCLLEEEDVKETIATFETKHLKKSPNLKYSELVELKKVFEEQACFCIPNVLEAKNILTAIKQRKKTEVYARNFQENMQHMVLDEQWKGITEKQSTLFEGKVCESLLKQSQYEKQMASRMCQVRQQKKVFAENRKMIENLKVEQSCKEYDNVVVTNEEIRNSLRREDEQEKERLAELHKKVYSERVRARRQFLASECVNIIESIMDVAIRVSEIREVTSCQVPKAMMKDMKELFFKNLPIFDVLVNYEELYVVDIAPCESSFGEETECEEGILVDSSICNQLKDHEKQRQSVLNDTDFMDYMNLLGPWMVELLFPDATEREVQQLVLGYVVHKLLEVKYPVPNQSLRVTIKPMKPKVLIQDLESEAGKMLADLMEACRILVVEVNDAINFVLSAYKDELSVVRDIDISFKKLSEKALQEKPNKEKEKEVKKKISLLKTEEPTVPDGMEPDLLDKETQTPRMIPDDDPLLTPNATIGKLAFEFLGAGDPVPDVVIVAAIIAYVGHKQDDYDGWVLLNYPRLYVQASDLEYSLTGYRLLPIDNETSTLEDVEGFSYRDPCTDPFNRDDMAEYRVSKLVVKPNFEAILPKEPSTYFDKFIKMKKLNDMGNLHSGESNTPLSVEEFYTDQKVMCVHEYSALNFQTIKNIGKIILSENPTGIEDFLDITPKTSLEIFGPIVNDLNDKYDPTKKKVTKVGTKADEESVKPKPLPKPKIAVTEDVETPDLSVVEKKTTEGSRNVGKKSTEGQVPPPKPGERDWQWATGIQSELLLKALASLWENMEAVFIEDLKDVFFCLRTHRTNVLSYCAFIRNSVRNVMRQPDDKQKVLCDFQQMFNDIDLDLRPDVEIKCELHVRVSELEEALLGIADDRKANSLKDVSKITQDGWVADEMANLVNQFLNIVQLEADRCTATCQVLMDYYSSLQQRGPEERGVAKVTIAKLQIKDRKYSILSSSPNKTSSGQINTPKNCDFKRSMNRVIAEQGSRANFERVNKTRSWIEKRRKSSDTSFLTGASEIITEILVNLSMPNDGVTPFHNFFKESVHTATTEITSILEGYISDAKKGGDKTVAKNAKGASGTKTMAGGSATLEWEAGLSDELSRFLFRSRLILARGIFDMNEFLATMLNTISVLTEDINDMYMREVESIFECCKVFRCCIEEETPVKYQLILKEDEFFIEEDALLITKEEELEIAMMDKEQKIRFTIEQLSLLYEKLNRVAPDGEIIKRSLLFILEDLRVFNPEVKTCNCFPEAWRLLDPEDLSTILNEVYQDLEIVPWRDFLIYAMDLYIPTEEQVLSMRKQFKKRDPEMTELISREEYKEVEFWFECPAVDENTTERMIKAKDLLFRMFQVDDHQVNYSALLLAFCKDENPIYGFTKALALVMGKKISTNEYADEEFLFMQGEGARFEDDFTPDWDKCNSKKPCTPASDSSRKCYPKERIVRCPCAMPSSSTTEEEPSDAWNAEQVEEPGEATNIFYNSYDEESVAFRVPYTILSSLLKASFPSLSQLSLLLDCKQTFQDTLNSMYDSLGSHDDQVEVYKLLRHKFMSRLIQCTNKFRFIKLRQILLNTLKAKNMSSQSFCSLFNLHCDYSP